MSVVTVMAAAAPPRIDERIVRVHAAGFARRLLAAAVDVTLLGALTGAATLVAALALSAPLPRLGEVGPDLLVAGLLDRNPMALGAMGLFAAMNALYQIYFTGISGQTLGKRLLGLRTISSRGTVPGPGRACLRLLALAPSVLPGALGWLWCLFDREHRALHDHLAGTYVILDEDL